MEKTSEVSPNTIKAPFFLRCAALLIDYMLLLCVPVAWLAFAQFIGEAGTGLSIPGTAWLLVLLLWVIDFLLFPLFHGRTFGKTLAGITIMRTDGRPVRLGRILLRNVLGYMLTALTLGIGFFIAAVNKSGRSLHDHVGGTVVVYGGKRLV